MKINKTILMWVIGILFIMSIMPGQGNKMDQSTQSIVATEYTCTEAADCPSCVGGGIIDYNETDPSFLGELSTAQCVDNTCQLSDACLVWDCGSEQENCNSVKQTVLDNTIGRLQENPTMLLFIAGFVIVWLML